MKKILALGMAIVIAASFSACGGTKDETEKDQTKAPETTAAETLSDEEIYEAIKSGELSEVISKYSPEVKEELVNAFREEGCELTFGDDGSTTFIMADGSVAIQDASGKWTYKTADGQESVFDTDWPDNEYTQRIPAPEMIVGVSGIDGENFIAMFVDASIDDMAAYAAEIKNSGFDQNVIEERNDEVYYFSAGDNDGYLVTLYSDGTNIFLSMTLDADVG